MRRFNIFIIFILFLSACAQKTEKRIFSVKYPSFDKRQVSEIFFGDTLEDSHRNLENVENPEVVKWFNSQNNLYKKIIDSIENKESLKKDLEKFVYSSNIRSDIPKTANGRIFYLRYFVKENVEKLYYRNTINDPGVEIFSTASINKDTNQTFVVSYLEPSFDGSLLALGISEEGTENTSIYILDVNKKSLLKDTIKRAIYGNVQWLKDGSGFYYNQLKELNSEKDKATPFEGSRVKFHFLNKSVSEDKIVFSTENSNLKLKPVDFPIPYYVPNSNRVIVSVFHGSYPYTTLFFADLKDDPTLLKWNKIISSEESVGSFAIYNDYLFFISFKTNPNGTLKRRNLANRSDSTTVIVGKEEDILNTLILTDGGLYLKTVQKGISSITEINPKTLSIKVLKLPFKGTASIKSTSELDEAFQKTDGLFFSLTSWSKENAMYFYDSKTGVITETDIRPIGAYGNRKDIIVEEIEISAWDGKLIPLSIVYSDKIKKDGTNPTILEGYGAYGLSLDSYLDLARLPWIERGGIFAVAHVRGGGEKGDSWYKGGFKETKPNSWKDFISCAQYLIDNKYTSTSKLAAQGGSAGGITVGRAIIEKPELFKAAIIDVGSLNPLRDEFTSNTLGVSEFGTIKDSLEFTYLRNMDVYHNLKKDQNYPSILFTAGMNDPRVAVWQPAKAVARMQEYSTGENVLLFRVTDSGHYGDSKEQITESTEKYAFLLWQLGHPEYQLKK